jgi:hypothetical protein
LPQQNASMPTQICTWLEKNSGYDGSDLEEPGESQWLYCLKDTWPGERQIVWSGVHGRGIIAVVDFSGEVRPRRKNPRLYEGWAQATPLPEPVSVEAVLAHRTLASYFSRPVQGVQSLDANVAAAIEQTAGGLPAAVAFDEDAADWREEGGDWSGFRLPPEQIVEDLVLNRRRLARRIGFPSKVNPGGHKRRLPSGRVPDLWCDEGVVGDAKNQVRVDWGPDQIEDYIAECDGTWPAYRWRGVLVQGDPLLPPSAQTRLQKSPYRDRLTVWFVAKRDHSPRYDVERLFPA